MLCFSGGSCLWSQPPIDFIAAHVANDILCTFLHPNYLDSVVSLKDDRDISELYTFLYPQENILEACCLILQ